MDFVESGSISNFFQSEKLHLVGGMKKCFMNELVAETSLLDKQHLSLKMDEEMTSEVEEIPWTNIQR